MLVMADFKKTYIQQIRFDGMTYTKGSTVELYDRFKVVCSDFPFVLFPKRKDMPTREWTGEHGTDIYVPDEIPLKEYDVDATFLFYQRRGAGVTDETIRESIKSFIGFLYGRVKGAAGDSVQSGRLAVYNEHTGIGRKDIVVAEVSNEIFFSTNYDDDVVAEFRVRFTVFDPVTDVTVTNGNISF